MPLDVYEKHPIALAREKARADAMAAAHDETQDYCRICRGEGSFNQPLYYPCKCSGSIKYVHQECLMEWLSHSQKKYCELCKTSFRFTKIYHHSMPATLPFPLFLRQLVRHAVQGISRWVRYLAVGFIWLGCLPWCIRQVWRGLFWLADGGWLSMNDAQIAAEITSNVTSTSAAVPSAETLAANFTVPEYLEQTKWAFLPVQLSLADMARILFSQGLIGRLLQLIFSLFIYDLGHHSASANASNASLPSPPQERAPSILSDVEFLANWSASPAVNHATIDIVEGQLICVLLVTAFILVFLIREWVINQQNIPNLPDADLAEVPPPGPPVEEQAQVALLPPHEHHHAPAVDGNGAHPDMERGQRPIAIPRLRRALTDDNILNVTNPVNEHPEAFFRDHSLSNHHDLSGDHDAEDTTGESSAVADDSVPRPVRRHSLSNSILVQRGFEVSSSVEGVDATVGDASPSEARSDWLPEDLLHAVDSVQLDQSATQGFEGSSSSLLDHNTRTISVAEEVEPMDEADQDISRPVLGVEGTDSDSPTVPTPGSSDAGPASTTGEVQGSGNVNAPANTPRVEETTPLEQLWQWLWHTEDSGNEQPATRTQQGGNVRDDEEIVGDAPPEAPFVPNHNQEAPEPGVAAPPPPPVRDAREPDFFLGVDLNDPNAADDAEDLDGVLELLGMEGPIFGMVQNVIFCLFLITVTLTASVWCPYIWGKIALLVFSNPVTMLVKAPLFFLSKAADILFDIVFFVGGVICFGTAQAIKLTKFLSQPLLPALSNILNPMPLEEFALDLSDKSGARLDRTLSRVALHLKPDLPTFSMASHQALKSFKASLGNGLACLISTALVVQDSLTAEPLNFPVIIETCGKVLRSAPGKISNSVSLGLLALRNMPKDMTSVSSAKADEIDYSLVEWSTQDRILTIVLGYAFFAIAGVLFLHLAHAVLGLQENEKVEGYLADSLRQAGGVMKVVIIIGIEMLVFPLYCGLLLDVALIPLFSNATFASRIAFMIKAPFTGIFLHWFIGTCYMFHFALFVSICRKIMRTGVLYFIRDPDDPHFHPVRDVLERPIPAQLGKIAFSALVYGGLVIVCLGGVVWSLNSVGGIFPIQWATAEPKLAFPMDVIFYNFMLPFILRKAEPSKKISAMYKWWFGVCARGLRLTNFLFGEEREDEKYSRPMGFLGGLLGVKGETASVKDGTYVRAPASDSVRIPKGRNVFLEVTEQNERVDGLPDPEHGIHGKNDGRFTKVYLPPRFQARIAAFVVLVWLFAASTGVTFTVGPLLLGRKLTQLLSHSTQPPNDLYAFTVGIHIFAIVGYTVAYARSIRSYLKTKLPQWFGPQFLSSIQYGLGVAYLGLYSLVILPFVLSLITELYIHVPLLTYMETRQEHTTAARASTKPVPTIYILQSWTVGLLYLRLLLRLFSRRVARRSRVATAQRAITRNGYLKPDVRLASRAFVLPTSVVCLGLLGLPLVYGKAVILVMRVHDPEDQMRIFRMAYPAGLGLVVLWLVVMGFQRQLASWRVKIRDEVYLIGERLHNFHEPPTQRAGKEKAL